MLCGRHLFSFAYALCYRAFATFTSSAGYPHLIRLLLTIITEFNIIDNINIADLILMLLCTCVYVMCFIIHTFTNRNRSSDQLPDIIWCREPFFEVMNEIEDIN